MCFLYTMSTTRLGFGRTLLKECFHPSVTAQYDIVPFQSGACRAYSRFAEQGFKWYSWQELNLHLESGGFKPPAFTYFATGAWSAWVDSNHH